MIQLGAMEEKALGGGGRGRVGERVMRHGGRRLLMDAKSSCRQVCDGMKSVELNQPS
jgi:hypothetical protein